VEDSINIDDQEHYNALILNKDPYFMNDSDRFHLDYRLDTLSPAKMPVIQCFWEPIRFLNLIDRQSP
jgi:hypothetical protein